MNQARSYEVPVVPVPPTLYKYCPPERIDILESLKIRFSPPGEFNDTFDSYHLIALTSGARAKLERAAFRRRLGVLCLTERPDDQLMWVNYAYNHAGFVIGFDAQSHFFRMNDRLLRKVQYQRKPEVLPAPNKCACFYKPLAWKYEQEWRCVREFESSESRLVEIEPGLITRIVIGHRMESWYVARLALCLQALDIPADVFVSTPAHKSWQFFPKPKSLKLCECCGGNGYTMEDRD